MISEQRKVKYLFIDLEQIKDKIVPTEEQIKEYFQEHEDEYKIEKQVKASHILIKVPAGAEKEQVDKAREKINNIREKILKGEDFAELAKKFSEDPTNAEKGGDLGFFSKGRMAPEFENAVFSLKKDELSQPVKTSYGYHLIKVTDIKEEHKQSLEEVKSQVELSLKKEAAWEKALESADRSYTELIAKGKMDNKLEDVSKEQSLELKQTDYFFKGGRVKGVFGGPKFSQAAFELVSDEISEPVKLNNGYAIISLLETKAPYLPELEEVKQRVEMDLTEEESLRLAKEAAKAAHDKLISGKKLDEIAAEYELEVKNTDYFTRIGGVPGIGSLKNWTPKLFALKPNQPAPLIEMADKGKFYLMMITEKQPISEDKFKEEKAQFAFNLRRQKAGQIFNDWIKSVRQQAEIEINEDLIR